MSVLEKVKQKVGLGEQAPEYECDDCDRRFRSAADKESYWFQCPDCGSDDVTRVESA